MRLNPRNVETLLQYPPLGAVSAPPLSAQLRDAAQTLAGQIEGGAFEALTPDGRCDLRELSMTMARWSDLMETTESAVPINRWPRRRWLSGLARAMRGCFS